MERDQLFVIIARAPLGEHTADVVAVITGVLQRIVRHLIQFMPGLPMLHFPHGGSHFLGSESVVIAQIADDVADFRRCRDDAVEADHSLDDLLPTVGCGPHEGDAAHHSVLVGLVTAAALLDGQFVVDGNSLTAALVCPEAVTTPLEEWRPPRRTSTRRF